MWHSNGLVFFIAFQMARSCLLMDKMTHREAQQAQLVVELQLHD